MVTKDQAVGWLIFLACIIVAIVYLVAFYLFTSVSLWLIRLPVVVAFIAVLAIGAWIGWTTATTHHQSQSRKQKLKQQQEKGRKRQKRINRVQVNCFFNIDARPHVSALFDPAWIFIKRKRA